MSSLLARRIHHQVDYEIANVFYQLDKLSASHYPTPAIPSLLSELAATLKATKSRLSTLVKDPSEDPADVVRMLRLAGASIQREILPLLGWLRNAETRQVPWSLVGSIESLASQLLPGMPVILSSTSERNYEISGPWLRRYAFVFVPSLHRTNVLWHVLVGHELFHPIAAKFVEAQRARVVEAVTPRCREWARQGGLSAEHQLFLDAQVHELVQFVVKIWERGMEELLCDLGAVALFGPSACIAAMTFAARNDLDTPPRSPSFYPPWRRRFRAMAGFLAPEPMQRLLGAMTESSVPEIQRHAESFRAQLASFDSDARAANDVQAMRADRALVIAYEEVDRSLLEGREFVRTAIPPSVATWDQRIDEVPALLERLVHGIPPGEVGRRGATGADRPAFSPSSLSAIMLAAWIYEVDWQLHGDDEARERMLKYDTLCRLTLKGCEDAELRRAWTERNVQRAANAESGNP